jgi:hypothetical protein
LLVLVFSPEDGDDIFLRNIDCLSSDYTALYLFTTTAVGTSIPTKIKVNFSLFHVMKVFGEVGLRLHVFITLALDRNEGGQERNQQL